MLKNNRNGIITLGFELLDTGKSFDKASLKKIFGDFVNIESKKIRSNDDSEFGTILIKTACRTYGGRTVGGKPVGDIR